MGVTVFLLDNERRQRAAYRGGISELIHSEADGGLEMEARQGLAPKTGEHLAFVCRDGRGRLFEVQTVDSIDGEGVDDITAKDAARAELETTICESAEVANKKATESLQAILAGSGWELGTVEADGQVGNIAKAEFEPIASAMIRIADTAGVRLVPHFLLDGGRVVGKRIDMLSAEPVWRGRIISARTAEDIVLSEESPPMGRVYALGGYTEGGTQDRQRVTLADVEWSIANGDPVDKPAGQAYIDLPGYTGAHRRAYIYQNAAQRDPQALAQEAWQDLQSKAKPRQIGQAKAGDISFAEGYKHAQVQVNDLVGVRSRSGQAVRERIANVRWHYIFPELTMIEFGEEQKRLWITTQIEETIKTARGAGGGVAAVEQVVEDNGVELYRAIEQLVEIDDRTVTEFREVWIDLDATRTEITQKASLQQLDDLTGQFVELSTTVTTGVDGLRVTIQQGDEIVAALKSTIDGLENWVTDADGNISELTNSVRGLESTVKTADGRVVTLANTADGLTATLLEQDEIMAQLRLRVDEIAANVSDTDGNIGGLTVQADRVAATVKAVDGRVADLAVTADGLVFELQDQSEAMAAIRARIDEIALEVQSTNGALGRLTVQSDRIEGVVSDAADNMSSRLTMLAGVIELETKADGSAVSLRLDAVDKTLKAQADEIELRATAANLKIANDKITANAREITFKADKADLGKYATVEQLETEFSRIDDLEAGITTAKLLRATQLRITNDATFGSLSAGQATLTALTIDSKTGGWKEQMIVEGVSLTLSKATLPVYSSTGTLVGSVEVVTNATISQTRNTHTIYAA